MSAGGLVLLCGLVTSSFPPIALCPLGMSCGKWQLRILVPIGVVDIAPVQHIPPFYLHCQRGYLASIKQTSEAYTTGVHFQ